MKELVELFIADGWAVPWGLLVGALTAGGFAIYSERDKGKTEAIKSVHNMADVASNVIGWVDNAGRGAARNSRDLFNSGVVDAAISDTSRRAKNFLLDRERQVVKEIKDR